MKKALVATTLAATLSTMAQAGSIELYGTVDLGFDYTHSKTPAFAESEGPLQPGRATSTTDNTFRLSSGVCDTTLWGIRGSEELAPGYAVNFVLESEFAADTGEADDRLFGHEASLTLTTPCGSLSFGRMGSMTSSTGTYDIYMSRADVLDGGWATSGQAIGASNFFYDHDNFDNMVTYASPEWAGLQFYAQYSFQTDSLNAGDEEVEGRPSTDRYIGAGLTYSNGPFECVAVVDSLLRKHEGPNPKNSLALSVGGNYDFGPVRLFLAGQWGKYEKSLGGGSRWQTQGVRIANSYMKGYTLHTGLCAPVAGGDLKAAFYYSRAKDQGVSGLETSNPLPGPGGEQSDKVTVYNIALTYEYALSKRTKLYAGAGYAEAKHSFDSSKTKNLDVTVGMSHSF